MCIRDRVEGLSAFSRVVTIDQAQAPRMRRSNVATFTGLYDALRRRFAALPEARALGLHAGSFSFNAKGGRCERCEGMGTVTSNLLFFEDAEVPCPECHGRRFQESVLSVRLDGRSIDDALNLSVEEAAAAFSDVPAMQKTLALLADVCLLYTSFFPAQRAQGVSAAYFFCPMSIAGKDESGRYALSTFPQFAVV